MAWPSFTKRRAIESAENPTPHRKERRWEKNNDVQDYGRNNNPFKNQIRQIFSRVRQALGVRVRLAKKYLPYTEKSTADLILSAQGTNGGMHGVGDGMTAGKPQIDVFQR